MIRKLIIPKDVGENAEVRVLLWYKSEGDGIRDGDAILEFETDKAIVLVTARQAGTLRRCLTEAGGWLRPGDVAALASDAPQEPIPADALTAAEALPATFETT